MCPGNAGELDLFQHSRQFLSTWHFHYLQHTQGSHTNVPETAHCNCQGLSSAVWATSPAPHIQYSRGVPYAQYSCISTASHKRDQRCLKGQQSGHARYDYTAQTRILFFELEQTSVLSLTLGPKGTPIEDRTTISLCIDYDKVHALQALLTLWRVWRVTIKYNLYCKGHMKGCQGMSYMRAVDLRKEARLTIGPHCLLL